MFQAGIGLGANLRKPCQGSMTPQNKSWASLEDHAVYHAKVEEEKQKHLLLIGPGQDPLMMLLVLTAHLLVSLRDLVDPPLFHVMDWKVMSLI